MEIEMCQEQGCKKKAKVLCMCSGTKNCLKHSHIELGSAHKIEYLRIQVQKEAIEIIINRLLQLSQSIHNTIQTLSEKTQKTIDKLYQDFIDVRNQLNSILIKNIKQIKSLYDTKKVKKRSLDYYEALLTKPLDEIKKIVEAWEIEQPVFNLDYKTAFISFSPSFPTAPDSNPSLISELDALNTKDSLYRYIERIKDNKSTLSQLLDTIKSSATNPAISIQAGRAFTILSRLNYDFSSMDLRGIKIRNADITHGKYNNTNFIGSNFSGVKLNLKALSSATIDFNVLSDLYNSQNLLNGHTNKVLGVKFSYDKKLLVSHDHETIRIWEVKTGNCLNILESRFDTILSVDISPDSSSIVSGSKDSSIKIWETAAGVCRFTLNSHTEPVNSVLFVNNECIASCSNDASVILYKIFQGTIEKFKGNGPIIALAISSDNLLHIAAANTAGDVILWNSSLNKVVTNFRSEHSYVTALAITPGPRFIITAGRDGFIKVWCRLRGKSASKVFDGKKSHLLYSVELFTSEITSINLCFKNKFIIATGSPGQIKLLKTKELVLCDSKTLSDPIDSIHTTQDLSLSAYSSGSQVYIRNTNEIFNIPLP